MYDEYLITRVVYVDCRSGWFEMCRADSGLRTTRDLHRLCVGVSRDYFEVCVRVGVSVLTCLHCEVCWLCPSLIVPPPPPAKSFVGGSIHYLRRGVILSPPINLWGK